MLDIFKRDDVTVGEIIGASIIILSMFALLALITRLVANPSYMGGATIKKSLSGAIALSLIIAAMAIVIRMVLIPTLQTLADSAYSFWDYVAALAIIAGAMFMIAGTIYIMSHNTGNFLNKIGAGVVFILFAKVIQTVILPLLQSIAEMGASWDLVVGVIVVAAICLALAGAMRIIFDALGRIITAISNLKAKQLVPIILSIGGVIAGIMLLGSYIKQNGSMMNIEEVGLILAGVGGIVLLLGLFAIMLNREFKGTNLKNFSKLLVTLTALVGVTGLAIGGLIFELNKLFGDDTRTAVVTLLSVALAMILIIGGSLQAFASAVSQISLAFTGLTSGKIKQVRNMFIIFTT